MSEHKLKEYVFATVAAPVEIIAIMYPLGHGATESLFRNSGDRFGNPEIVEVGKGDTFDLLWSSEPPLNLRWTWDDPMAMRKELDERFFLGCAFAGAFEYPAHVELKDGNSNAWLYVSTR
jgi:hypothetical protein